MDRDDRERHGEPGIAPSAPHHEASLTGHVSPQLRSPPASTSISPARHLSPHSSPSQLLPDHPFNFSFPTLNLDGSLPDLTTQPPRRYPPTPPAALSTLGAKARMANHDDSYRDSELTDGQYDMIDDLSEISTDDHDTASITSNGEDGQLTPDDAGSEVDADESMLLNDQHVHTPPSTSQSFVDIPARAREVVESYTSEDLETPRQSTMPIEKIFRQLDNVPSSTSSTTTLRTHSKSKKDEHHRSKWQFYGISLTVLVVAVFSSYFFMSEGLYTFNGDRYVPATVTPTPRLTLTSPTPLVNTRTDISKTVSKDVAVVSNVSRTLTDKLSTEFGASVWATKNITTQLALYVSRDLQVFGKSAVSFLEKAAKAGNKTASNLSKDFVVVRRDVARVSKELSLLVRGKAAEAKDTSKALIRDSLALSRHRIQGFKKALGLKTTPAKEVSEMTRSELRRAKKEARKHKQALKKEAQEHKKTLKREAKEPKKMKNWKRNGRVGI